MTMDTTNTSRYQDVQFQSKTGTLIISAEKVVFRPKLDKTPPPGTKATSRSWRWTAIDRMEVMDPARGAKHRSIKLKSNSADNKAVTLKVPNELVDAVLKDIKGRLGSRLNIEGAISKSSNHSSTTTKKPLPAGMRRKSMTSAGSRRSIIEKTTPRRSSMAAPSSTLRSSNKDNHATKEQARRASMLATRNKPKKQQQQQQQTQPEETAMVVVTKQPEPELEIPVKEEEPSVCVEEEWHLDDQSDIKKTESEDAGNNNNNNRLRNLVGQKLKPKLASMDKYRQVPESPKEEAKQGLLSGEKKTTPTTKRGFLNFMKSPTQNRRSSTANEDEIAAMEQKAREQEARILEQQRKAQEREAAMLARRYSLNKRRGSMRSPKTPSPLIHSKPKVIDNPAAFSPPQVYRPGPPSVFAPGDLGADESHHATAKTKNEIVFHPTKTTTTTAKQPEEDETSRTSASSAPDSPGNKEAEDTFPEPPENNAALWNPDAPENKFRIMILHHAATCQMTNGCPYDPICCEYRNVLKHIETCSDDDCGFQHCKATRDFLLTMRLMTSGNDQHRTTSTTNKDFLIGMGAIAPVPVIHVGDIQSQKGDWDAFSAVSNSTWWEKAGS